MNKILKASAGTGKTYRLSLEFVAALLQDISYDEIVVMTFTRKATAEIRERILEHLEDIMVNGEESEVLASLLKIYPELDFDQEQLTGIYGQMLQNKDRININTIDSFINRIFKQAIAPYLGIYSYQVVDEDINEETIEAVFKEMLDNPADFALLEKFLTDNPERDVQPYLDLIKGMLRSRWKFLLIEHQPRKPKETGDLTGYLDRCHDILETIAEERGKEFSAAFYINDFKALMPEYLRLTDRESKQDLIIKNSKLFFKNSFWNGRQTGGKALEALKEEMEATYEQFLRQLACRFYNEEMIPYEEEIFAFSERVFAIYDRVKFREKEFTHIDISNYTYKYLTEGGLDLLEGENVSSYFFELLGSEVKCLLIDEFQDTSILQWKILKPLIDACPRAIAVGDEKQSIYGWRGGEKELFAGLDKIIEADCESLRDCYRSHRTVMEFINGFFLNLGLDWDYERVEHRPEKGGGYVEILLGGEGGRVDTTTKTFARMSKEKQERYIEQNEKIISNLKGEIARQVKELPAGENIGILARKNDDLMEIADELDKEGVPYILESKDSLTDHPAIKPLYFLLSYLNYHDYFKLVQFLRSDLVGINNQALKYVLRHKREVEAYLEGRDAVIGLPDLQRVLAEVRKLRQMAYTRLTNQIIEESGVIQLYADNSMALKNIYFFFKLMRSHSSLAEFMAYLEEKDGTEELKQVGVREEAGVKLMTIHKAKGLTFDTEFFYWKVSGGGGGYSDNMELYISFGPAYQEVREYLLTSTRYRKYFEYLAIGFAEEEDEKALMEEINNIYVALTRPSRNLFFYIEAPRQLKTDKEDRCWSGSSYGFFEDALLAGAEAGTLCELVERRKFGVLEHEGAAAETCRPAIPELADYFRLGEVPAELIEEVNHKKNFRMTLEMEKAKIEGLAIHYYLEHIRHASEEERDFARKMALARYGNILGPQNMAEIIRRVESYISSHPHYFAARWQVFNEYELKDGDDLYRIDRLLLDEEKKEILILDYKSGVTKEQAQLAKYRELIEERVGGEYKVRTEFLEI